MGTLTHYQQGGENGVSISLTLAPEANGTIALSVAAIPGSQMDNQECLATKCRFFPEIYGDETQSLARYVYDLIVEQLDVVGWRYCTEQQRAITWIGKLLSSGQDAYYCQDEDDEY